MKKIFLLAICSFLVFTAISQDVKEYKVSIAFNSIGTGVPNDAPLIAYIKNFKKKYKVKSILGERIGPLGREGEYKIGFMLKELTKTKQTIFINGLKKTASTMNDRGSADVTVNDSIDLNSLGRSTVEKVKF